MLLSRSVSAAEHYGRVSFAGVAVPGATVTASQGDKRFVTSTDQEGVYRLSDLDAGAWTLQIEMLGFSTIAREITVAEDVPPATWELTLLKFEELIEMVRLKPDATTRTQTVPLKPDTTTGTQTVGANPTTTATTTANPTGFRRADVTASAAPLPPRNDGAFAEQPDDGGIGAADGFLINGSVNNSAASPFAQLRAFGNSRPGQRSLYNGGLGILAGHSAWDARPYSFSGQQTSKPSYGDLHVLGSFGGPLRIPGLVRNGANLFVGYQRTADHNASTQSALMPTILERGGDLSATRDAQGRSVQIVDPKTGQPFAGNIIPSDRISPQAASLLAYYPHPNVDSDGRYNYQTTLLSGTRQDSVQSRATQPIDTRNQLSGTFAFQRTTTDTTNLFGFEDTREVSGVDTAANWSHRFSMLLSVRMRYQYTRLTDQTTAFFAGRTNVSGEAGITGNNQDPINWGPPALTFASGLAGLADGLPSFTRTRSNALSAEAFLGRGRHNLTFGGGLRRHGISIRSQQDPRGAFSFTGFLSGSDLADFLLGIPQTSSIAYGNAEKFLRGFSYDAFLSDDWRVSPSLTITAGVRWEYESPFTERLGRLVNLDVAPGFTAASAVVADNPVGTVTGQRYPASLLQPDRSGLQPRIGAAWRPVAGSSLVVRGGYGVYRNTSVYQSIATLLAQQPPLSTTLSVASTAANPLTLANGFVSIPGATANTFAVDPGFRVGSAHNWQVSLQRDLPGSLNVMTTYLGTKGSRLMQQFLPNTFPSGAANPCPACPTGFVYLASNGSSARHAAQVQLRRRLRNGLSATTMYTLAKAIDDAAAFAGANLAGAAIAQDWLNLDAERGPSNFDQRHLLTAQLEYTTGIGVRGGGLLTGLKGALVKGWTVTSQLSVGSGLPLTPVYLASVPGTGVTGTIRADLTGGALTPEPGYYLNPLAYAPPASGRWGNAGRNSVTGPSQFSLNAGLSRTFSRGERMNLDWRIDANNVLNRVTYAGVNTLIGSPQFGLPSRANPMRKLQTSLRLRF
jgi:hypothetical protein